MGWKKDFPLILIMVLTFGTGSLQFGGEASGVVIPDYDIHTSTTIVFINGNTGQGSFSVSVENRCLHTLTINIRNSCPGLQVSPAESTLTIAPEGSANVSIAVLSASDTPHGVYALSIAANISQVDGVKGVAEKERHAQIVVMMPRHQSFSCSSESIQVKRGETVLRYISVNNIGNARDYVSLKFHENGTLSAWSGTGFLSVPPGESAKYPVIISVPDSAKERTYALDYTMTSLVNKNVTADGKCVVTVGNEIEHNTSPANGFLIPASGFMVLLIAILLWHTDISSGMRSALSPASIIVFLILGSVFLTEVVAQNAEAQNPADYTISVNPFVTQLDVSPFTPDASASGRMEIIIESQTSFEQVIRLTITVPHLTTGYVHEVRVPAGGTVKVPVGIAVEKEAPYNMYNGNIHIETIERAGIPVSNGQTSDSGFMGVIARYSLPELTPQKSVISIDKGTSTSAIIRVTNLGNMVDIYNFSVLEPETVEKNGYRITLPENNETINSGEGMEVRCDVLPLDNVKEGLCVVVIQGRGGQNSSHGGECPIFLVNKPSHEKSRSDFIPGFETALLVATIAAFGIAAEIKRRRKENF